MPSNFSKVAKQLLFYTRQTHSAQPRPLRAQDLSQRAAFLHLLGDCVNIFGVAPQGGARDLSPQGFQVGEDFIKRAPFFTRRPISSRMLDGRRFTVLFLPI